MAKKECFLFNSCSIFAFWKKTNSESPVLEQSLIFNILTIKLKEIECSFIFQKAWGSMT